MTSTGTAGLLSPAGALSSRAAPDRIRRYLYEELGPQRGSAGAGLARAWVLFGESGDPQDPRAAGQIAMAAGECGLEAVVEEDPARARARAAARADAGLPVVVSGSFHLPAAVRLRTTTR